MFQCGGQGGVACWPCTRQGPRPLTRVARTPVSDPMRVWLLAMAMSAAAVAAAAAAAAAATAAPPSPTTPAAAAPTSTRAWQIRASYQPVEGTSDTVLGKQGMELSEYVTYASTNANITDANWHHFGNARLTTMGEKLVSVSANGVSRTAPPGRPSPSQRLPPPRARAPRWQQASWVDRQGAGRVRRRGRRGRLARTGVRQESSANSYI